MILDLKQNSTICDTFQAPTSIRSRDYPLCAMGGIESEPFRKECRGARNRNLEEVPKEEKIKEKIIVGIKFKSKK